ncbi:NACHT domain-containing NTPase [Micromonospora sp. MA102]|uniref:NACHT domain-containing protein n=1 Tax=Micromonospora sp. MA102 TaxID=2952755 RepID=UPI0021C943C5|nr:AAA family ATPase [Micromonospora sp. MA102]
MPDTLSYADAVRLLGGEKSRFVDWFDKLTSAVPVPPLLGVLDARGFVRLGHELVRTVSEQRSGLSRHGRTQRLQAAHAVIAVTAFYEALAQVDLPFTPADLALDKGEQLALAGAGPVTGTTVTEAFFSTAAPVPGAHLPYPNLAAALSRYYDDLAHRLLRFCAGLAVWEQADQHRRDAAESALLVVPRVAVGRHRELLTQLAQDFPEVGFWLGLQEHEATRQEVRSLSVGLAEMRQVLTDISTGHVPDRRRAGLAAAHAAELRRPILPSGEVPAGLQVPTLGEAYVAPLCRIVKLSPSARPTDETWWSRYPLRDDLWQSLLVHLTTAAALTAPLLVLGQPGSGKSVLTRVLAAQLPAADFLVIRVELRAVQAVSDLQDQIEQAVRNATGEALSWPDLVRSAGDAMPVVLLDGFDELLQATGASQSDYLRRVAVFQRREADQGRPVAVLVTSRSSVADRALPPPGTVVLRLEPFDETRIDTWVDTWNRTNSFSFETLGVSPLDAQAVRAHKELAEQPLLLLMLALYAADGHDLRDAGGLGRGDLYERLLTSFARREVAKQDPWLSQGEVVRATEDELRRLSVVAFGMFNRGAQWLTEDDLEADLDALPFLGHRPPLPAPDRGGMRGALRHSEIVLGRFFFVHRSEAVLGSGLARTYEFLHATFGEYLIARSVTLVLQELVEREAASLLGEASVDDDRLHALLSFAVLTSRAPVVTFVAERLAAWPPGRRSAVVSILSRLFRNASDPRPTGRHRSYQPRPATVPARCAVYSANLLVLALCVTDLPSAALYGNGAASTYRWRRQALQWRAQLPEGEYLSLLTVVRPTRTWADGSPELLLSIRRDDEPDEVPGDPRWQFRRSIGDPSVADAGSWYGTTDTDVELLHRTAYFECDPNVEAVLHALEPLGLRFSDRAPAPTTLRADMVDGFYAFPDGDRSEARLLLDVALLPLSTASAGERERIYERLLAAVGLGEDLAERAVAALVLERMAVDDGLAPGFVADALRRLAELSLTVGSHTPAFRCLLAFLGRDDRADLRFVALAADLVLGARGFAAGRGRPADWLDEAGADVLVRLHELELRREPISAAEAESFRQRCGRRRPDLVERLRPLADADWVG